MSYVERLRWGEVEPRIQKIFEALHQERGNVPNLFRVMGQRAPLLTSFSAHYGKVMGEGTVDVRLKEMLSVRVSQINDCEY